MSQAKAEPNLYLETINKPQEYVGYLARTGEAICRIRWSPERDRFVWQSTIPESEWTQDMGESLLNQLTDLNARKAELTRPLRIREIKEEKEVFAGNQNLPVAKF
jgi:hypothetical protein